MKEEEEVILEPDLVVITEGINVDEMVVMIAIKIKEGVVMDLAVVKEKVEVVEAVVKTRVWVVIRSILVEMDAEVMVEESMIGSD